MTQYWGYIVAAVLFSPLILHLFKPLVGASKNEVKDTLYKVVKDEDKVLWRGNLKGVAIAQFLEFRVLLYLFIIIGLILVVGTLFQEIGLGVAKILSKD
ncbi:hypothetical protein [uncultured Thalassolituus sp.]|uniref:hypothetical protein n=1 Tax=uncultured Thalassolituus sp. TaxID=285273 RepID=UPI0026170993|nr:hypothetical protein [uncultured Thalassolituus sp.]